MVLLDPRALATGLEPGDTPDLFRSRAGAQHAVDYPDEAHGWCLSVEDDSIWFRHRNACILAAVANLPPPGPILDVGAGNGFVSLALQQGGIETIVLEPGILGARHALMRGLRPVICSTFEDAAFRAEALPAVGLFDVLEHIDDDVGFLQMLHRAMAVGGLIYITVPSYNLLWSSNDLHSGHRRRYTLRSLTRALASAGFECLRGSYFMSLLVMPILLTRTLPSLLGFRSRLQQSRTRWHHASRSGVVGRAVASALSVEAKLLARGQRIPAGASCLVVARK